MDGPWGCYAKGDVRRRPIADDLTYVQNQKQNKQQIPTGCLFHTLYRRFPCYSLHAVWRRELKQGLCDDLEGWDGEEDGSGGQEREDMGVPMADSCWCMTENHKILQSNHPLIKNKKEKPKLVNKRLEVFRGKRWGVGKMGGENHSVQTSSYKINVMGVYCPAWWL